MATRRETAQVDVIINGEKSGETLKQLQQNTKQLYRELQNLVPGTEAFQKKFKELESAKTKLKEITGGVQQVENSFASFAGKAAAFAGINIGVDAAATAIVDFGKKSVQSFIEFEAGLAELRALTGVSKDELTFFAEEAEKIGSTTQSSAVQAVEAFKLMGSAVPSLLQNKEALVQVTKEAITLAEAAGIQLPEAAAAMGSALNMFQLPASDAARIINSLAAGSQAGAVEVPQITESLKAFGVAAASFNVSFEESVALVETLGEFAIKGSEAGTALRNVLNKMATAQALPKEAVGELEKFGVNIDLVMNKQVPFNERLREFSKIGGDAIAITKVFGAENKIAGEILLNNVEKFESLNKAVTGTNTAYEQQAINAETTKAKLKILENQFESISATVGKALVNGFVKFIDILKAAFDFVSNNKTMILALGTAYATYIAAINLARIQTIALNTATAAATLAKKAYAAIIGVVTGIKTFFSGATATATTAMRAFSAAIASNPIGALITLLLAGVTAVLAWIGVTEDAAEATAEQNKELTRQEQLQKDLKEASENAGKSVMEEQARFNALTDRLKQLNPESETRKDLIKEINEKYGEYLPNLLTEGDSIDQITQKQALANAEFKKKIDMMVLQAQSDIYAKEIAQLKIQEAEIKRNAEAMAEFGDMTKKVGMAMMSSFSEENLKNVQSNIKNLERDFQKLLATDTPETASAVKKVDEKELKKQEEERKKIAKKQAEDAKKAQENIENMRLEAMEAGFEKEIAKLDLQFEKKMKALVGTPEQIKEQQELLYQWWHTENKKIWGKLDADEAKRQEKDKEQREKQQKEDLETLLYAIEKDYEAITEKEQEQWLLKNLNDEEFKQAVEEQNFEKLLEIETQREQRLFELKQQFLQEKLDALILFGQGETTEAQKIQNQMLQNQVEFNKKQIDNEKRTQEHKRKLTNEGLDVTKNVLGVFIDMLSQDEEARKRHAGVIKAIASGQVIIDGIKEVQGILAGYATLGPVGQAIAVFKTAIAIARTGLAINKINSTQYAKGGFLKLAGDMGVLPMQWNGNSYVYAKGGFVPQGSSHQQGGISLIDNRTGQHLGEMEGGEPIMILSKATYLNNKSIVDDLLQTSLYKSGAPIYKKFADGAIIDSGGQEIKLPENSNESISFGELVQEVRLLREDVRNFNGRLRAFVVLDDVNQAQEELNAIVQNNTI